MPRRTVPAAVTAHTVTTVRRPIRRVRDASPNSARRSSQLTVPGQSPTLRTITPGVGGPSSSTDGSLSMEQLCLETTALPCPNRWDALRGVSEACEDRRWRLTRRLTKCMLAVMLAVASGWQAASRRAGKRRLKRRLEKRTLAVGNAFGKAVAKWDTGLEKRLRNWTDTPLESGRETSAQ